MGLLDGLTIGNGKIEPAPEPRRPASLGKRRSFDDVNTNLCRFAWSVRSCLTTPLQEGSLSPLDWYELASSEDGFAPHHVGQLQRMTRGLAKFDLGNFAEFRTLRILDELKQEGDIDGYVTDYSLPKIYEDRKEKKSAAQYSKLNMNMGKNMGLDALKVDVMAMKETEDGMLYLPLQVKSMAANIRRTGGIMLEQKDGAALRVRFPLLKSSFESVQKRNQRLRVQYHYRIITMMSHQTASIAKTKKQIKAEICEALASGTETFASEPIKDFHGIGLLSKLLESKLLQGVPMPT